MGDHKPERWDHDLAYVLRDELLAEIESIKAEFKKHGLPQDFYERFQRLEEAFWKLASRGETQQRINDRSSLRSVGVCAGIGWALGNPRAKELRSMVPKEWKACLDAHDLVNCEPEERWIRLFNAKKEEILFWIENAIQQFYMTISERPQKTLLSAEAARDTITSFESLVYLQGFHHGVCQVLFSGNVANG